MVYDYLITLKRPDFKIADIVSQLLYLVAFSTFVFFALKSPTPTISYWVSAFLIAVIYVYLRVKKNKVEVLYYTPGFAIAAITFLSGPKSNLLLSAFYVACLFLEREFKFHKEIGFSLKGIVFNTLIKKHYEWSELNNVLIKDGLLTLDFKNNKIVQKEIEGDITTEIEDEFNEFCQKQILTNTTI